jgi:CBS domain-containing protein
MMQKAVVISADDSLRIVHDIMELGRVRHLPVVRRGKLVGVVSQRDLFHASLSNVIGLSREDGELFLEGVKIAEVMSAPPVTIGPDHSARAAAALMAERKIGCLPVLDGDEVMGILTETDLLRHFAALPPPEKADTAKPPKDNASKPASSSSAAGRAKS